MTNQELVDYYVNLLIVQYRTAPRAQATVAAFVAESVASQIIQQVEDAFDPDTAIGAQLDRLGQYVGANRRQFGLNLGKTFFAMPPSTSNFSTPGDFKGFAFASAYPDGIDWFFQVSSDLTAESELNDADMRSFILYLAMLNSLDLVLEDIDDFLFEFFGNFVTLTDNGDMTITIHHDSTDPNDLFEIVNFTGKLPSPAGVGVIVT